MTIRNKKIFVAMSGGVDSSVTVALLKERGFDVCGIHIKMWSPSASSGQAHPVCRQQYQDRLDAMRVAAKLDIPFETWDFTKEYRKEVVEYMIREYAAGRTPNPDVMCNRRIKFGAFLQRALEAGADYIATGHYVRLSANNELITNKRINEFADIRKFANSKQICYSLMAARDRNKDQSYFLWTLTQEQLARSLFPIGEFTKPEVRVLAKKFGLPTAEKPDSQGICFIGEINVREFLKKYILTRRGLVRSTSGKVIGEHEGLSFYTIGQREGLGIGGGIPYYVAAKEFRTNTLVVAEGPYDEKLFARELAVSQVNWISGKYPKFPLRCEARIRYRQPLQEATIEPRIKSQESRVENRSLTLDSEFLIHFKEPQRAVTPGQSIVFYKGEPFGHAHGREMLGGGVIE